MIDLAVYAGVDDSECKIKLGMADEIAIDEWASGGPICAIRYIRALTPEEYHKRQDEIIEIAQRAADRVYMEQCNRCEGQGE